MQRFSTWVRYIFTAIFIPIVIAVAAHFIEEQPQETANVVLKFLSDLWEQTWFRLTALSLCCFVAGLWVDWLLRKWDGSRAKQREALGAEMAKYGNYLGQFGSVPDSAKINSYFHSAREFGIWAPDEVNINRAEKLIVDYLKNVGTLLRDEHFRQAKQYAKASKARFQAR
jgi:hypothetical protein